MNSTTPKNMHPVALAFHEAFVRALEQWTKELTQSNQNARYVAAHARNEYCWKNGLHARPWGT